jgi:Na+/melibiose symporter-like transporter
VAILPFYKLTGPQLKTIQDELDQRHAEAVSG